MDAGRLRHALEGDPTRVVVVGGGVAGLAAARQCARPGFAVTVIEASETLGGCVAPLVVDGLTVDAGAESFATRGGRVAALLDELGLTDDVVRPNPAGAWVRLPDRTVPLPKAGLLGIPSSPLATDVVRAIGWGGAWRAYLDRIMPVMKIGAERNLGALVRRRMGAKVLESLVTPVVTGVYSAQADDLDVAVVAPGLNQALTRQGSLSGAVGELRGANTAGAAVSGIVGGMWRLVAALAADVRERGGVIETGVAVTSIEAGQAAESGQAGQAGQAEARWVVRLADGSERAADVVIVAAQAAPALELLATASTELASLPALGWPTASSVELVTLVVDSTALDAAPRGSGLLVADSDRVGVRAKASTHSTAKWSWLADQAGPGRHVVRLSYGRAGRASETAAMDDAALRALALADASTLYGIPLAESDVRAFARTPWTNALPYAALGERERIDTVTTLVDAVEGLEVTGAWVSGTGLASVVPDAEEAAGRARGLRWKAVTDDSRRQEQ